MTLTWSGDDTRESWSQRALTACDRAIIYGIIKGRNIRRARLLAIYCAWRAHGRPVMVPGDENGRPN